VKYLLWAVVIYIAWRWYAASKQSAARSDSSVASASSAASATEGATETMVKCAQCGIHLPHSEAIHGPGAITFCSEAHQATHRHGSL
jgi:uncharacterized protein